MSAYDTVVMGAGLAGLSVARELAKQKQKVLVIERENVGGGASRAAAGILDPYTEANEETPLLRLSLKAFGFYPSFLQEIQKKKDEVELQKTGLLYIAFSAEDEIFLRDRCEWQEKRGLPAAFLAEKELRKAEPVLAPNARSGFYYPEIEKLNADKLTSVLFSASQSEGAQIRTGVKQASVWVNGGKVRGVQLRSERIETPAVVLATGCWGGEDKNLGINLRIKPVRGQIFILRARPERYPKHILHTIRYAYIVPWPEGSILVGSTLEDAGFDNRVTPAGREDVLKRAGELLEDIGTFPIEASWAGLRPYAPEGPLIGPTRIPGLYLATGYHRTGVLISPFAGKLLAEGILTGKFSPLLEPFFPRN